MSSNPPSQEQEIESGALRRSAWLYLFMALLGLGFAYVAESDAILLDGIYSFISLLMTFVAQRVSRLVQTPYTDRFHFGFAHFEPLLNVVRILLILAIATFAAAAAVIALLDGGRPLNAGSAVIYGVVAASGCLAMAWAALPKNTKLTTRAKHTCRFIGKTGFNTFILYRYRQKINKTC